MAATSPRILGLIPARAGSVGIKSKNIYPIGGKPLIAYTIAAALKSAVLADVVLSTDSREIARVGERHGAEVPFLRPRRLAQSDSLTLDTVIYTLKRLSESFGRNYDAVCLLQPTSPLRSADDIRMGVRLFKRNRSATIVSLVRVEGPHPYKLKVIQNDRVHSFMPGMNSSVPRQQLPDAFALNGALYITPVATIFSKKTLLDEECTVPYIMPPERSINIDTPFDVRIAEYLLSA